MTRRLAPILSCTIALTLLCVACGQDDVDVGPGTEPTTPPAGSVLGSWVLQSWNLDGAPGSAPASATATATFGPDGTFSGDTGCNRTSGTYISEGTALTVTLGPTTRRACTDDAATAQEQAYLTLLPLVRSAAARDDVLELLDADGATVLSFAAGPSGLAGTSWQVTAVNNGAEALVGSALSEGLTAEFSADTVSGSTGCNTFTAAYTAEGGSISIDPPQSTLIGCPPEVAELEAQYLAALQRSTKVELEARSLTLRDAGGAAQVTFVPAD